MEEKSPRLDETNILINTFDSTHFCNRLALKVPINCRGKTDKQIVHFRKGIEKRSNLYCFPCQQQGLIVDYP